MLSPRLNDCPECADIPSLLKKIDCKLAELGNNLYNNISYMLNKPVPADDILQLIGYRRILTHKYCNPNYVHKYSVKMIASRVIRLTLGCVSRCNEPERCLEEPCDVTIVANPTTTSTTTLTTCQSYILYNTATSVESFLIGNCDTGQPETILLEGTSSVCIQTFIGLNVSPNIVVIETDSCTTSTTSSTSSSTTSTSSSSTSTSTTTSTTTIPPTSTTTTSSSSSSSTTTTTSTTNSLCDTCVGPPTVVIGTQTWTTCNLDVTTYRNGDIIPEVTDPSIWETLTTGAWCYYNNDSSNGPIYGKLYNWFAVTDPRGLAPVGYHVPSDAEWTILSTYLGGEGVSGVAGGKMKEVGLCHWDAPNTGATNESGFAGLPGGYNWYNAGFYNIGIQANFWSSTELPPPYTNLAYIRYLYYSNVYNWRGNGNKQTGYSVRLLVGEAPASTTTTTTTLAPSGINTIYTHFEAL